ncbi:hypothetical protein AS144_02865 [Francisella endosymbiont of Amblyomma maculatum]|nr:hypothetical protein AS144_02865 [Francisella endosymbiont of Amblyomma maculatum]
MLKNFLKSLFENIYTPEIDLLEYIQKPVRPCYKQIVDGHEIDYAGFVEHINKQRDYPGIKVVIVMILRLNL